MINILHLISTIGVYGAPKILLAIASRSNTYPFASYIAPLRDLEKSNSDLEETATQMGLKSQSIHCRSRFDLGVISRLTSIVKKHQISIIHSHNYKSNFYGLWAAKLCKIPIVATIHGWTGACAILKIYEYLDPFYLRFFDAVVAVSEEIKHKLIIRGVNENQINVIHNCINTDKFGQDKNREHVKNRKKWNIDKNTFLIGTVGRLEKEKGHTYLLKAVKYIAKIYPQTTLMLVGNGPLRDRLMNYARESGLENHTIFTGYQEDMPSIYAIMDLFVLPSLTEGIPLVLLEAMAAGKPVVASNVGGIPEVVKNRQNGILVKPGSSEDLVNAIIKFLNHPDLRIELGLSAKKMVRKNFSVNMMLEQYKTLYKIVANC